MWHRPGDPRTKSCWEPRRREAGPCLLNPVMDDFTTRTYGTSGLDNRPLFGETSARVRGHSNLELFVLLKVKVCWIRWSRWNLILKLNIAAEADCSTVVLAGSNHKPGSGRIYISGCFSKYRLQHMFFVDILLVFWSVTSSWNDFLLSVGDGLGLLFTTVVQPTALNLSNDSQKKVLTNKQFVCQGSCVTQAFGHVDRFFWSVIWCQSQL